MRDIDEDIRLFFSVTRNLAFCLVAVGVLTVAFLILKNNPQTRRSKMILFLGLGAAWVLGTFWVFSSEWFLKNGKYDWVIAILACIAVAWALFRRTRPGIAFTGTGLFAALTLVQTVGRARFASLTYPWSILGGSVFGLVQVALSLPFFWIIMKYVFLPQGAHREESSPRSS
jgi:hypothetical protein